MRHKAAESGRGQSDAWRFRLLDFLKCSKGKQLIWKVFLAWRNFHRHGDILFENGKTMRIASL